MCLAVGFCWIRLSLVHRIILSTSSISVILGAVNAGHVSSGKSPFPVHSGSKYVSVEATLVPRAADLPTSHPLACSANHLLRKDLPHDVDRKGGLLTSIHPPAETLKARPPDGLPCFEVVRPRS